MNEVCANEAERQMKQHWSAVVTAITSTFGGGGDDDDDGCGGGVLDVQCKSMAPVSLLSLSLSLFLSLSVPSQPIKSGH